MPRFVVPERVLARGTAAVTFSSSRWYGMIRCALPRHDAAGETSTPGCAELVHLLQQVARVHDHAVGDHAT